MPEEVNIDSLASLEERILKAVDLVVRLRSEKEAVERELSAARAQATQMALEMEQLRSERKQVRTRVEKLLGQMDLLSGE